MDVANPKTFRNDVKYFTDLQNRFILQTYLFTPPVHGAATFSIVGICAATHDSRAFEWLEICAGKYVLDLVGSATRDSSA